MKSLVSQIVDWLLSFGSVPHVPIRVGLLDTGELVLLDGHGNAQVLSRGTTGVIRNTLIETDPDLSELCVMPVGMPKGGDHAN